MPLNKETKPIVSLHFVLSGTRVVNSFEELCIMQVATVNLKLFYNAVHLKKKFMPNNRSTENSHRKQQY